MTILISLYYSLIYPFLTYGILSGNSEQDLQSAGPSTSDLNSSSCSTTSVDDTDDLSSLSDSSDHQDVNKS